MTHRMKFPAMKLDDWPAGDRRLWIDARMPGDIFDDPKPASEWRKATIGSTEHGYGIYLSWLDGRGLLDAEAGPMQRVDHDRIAAFIADYAHGRSELTVAAAVRGIAYVLRAVDPPDGLAWLTRLAHRLSNNATPSRPKLPRMASIPELVELTHHLMRDGARRLADGRRSGAADFRDGLMIAVLILRPALRRHNLAGLRLGHTLFVDVAGVRVSFSRHETKKKHALEFCFPEGFQHLIHFYLNEVRPVLLRRAKGEDEGWLWIGRRGNPMKEIDLSIRIGNVTQRHLGRRVSPHLFRDIATTTVALLDPAHVGISGTILGHASAISQKFYNQAASFTAVARHGRLLESLMDEEED